MHAALGSRRNGRGRTRARGAVVAVDLSRAARGGAGLVQGGPCALAQPVRRGVDRLLGIGGGGVGRAVPQPATAGIRGEAARRRLALRDRHSQWRGLACHVLRARHGARVHCFAHRGDVSPLYPRIKRARAAVAAAGHAAGGGRAHRHGRGGTAGPLVGMHAMAQATIGAALRTQGVDPGDARALLRAALGVDETHLAAHSGQILTREQGDRFAGWLRRRRAGEPVAYITGEREFYSLAFKVTPAVLIPRPETELLVELALECLVPDASAKVLDLGAGCGCVAVAIARQRPRARVTATDVSRAALAIARENAARHGTRIEFIESDWLQALTGRRFDLIVANPPYVAVDDPHLGHGDLRFEPRAALVGGADGLACIRSVVADSRAHLESGAWLW